MLRALAGTKARNSIRSRVCVQLVTEARQGKRPKQTGYTTALRCLFVYLCVCVCVCGVSAVWLWNVCAGSPKEGNYGPAYEHFASREKSKEAGVEVRAGRVTTSLKARGGLSGVGCVGRVWVCRWVVLWLESPRHPHSTCDRVPHPLTYPPTHRQPTEPPTDCCAMPCNVVQRCAAGRCVVWRLVFAHARTRTHARTRQACVAIDALCSAGAIDTLLSSFILPLQTQGDKNNRVHCSLNLNTETGRLSARR